MAATGVVALAVFNILLVRLSTCSSSSSSSSSCGVVAVAGKGSGRVRSGHDLDGADDSVRHHPGHLLRGNYRGKKPLGLADQPKLHPRTPRRSLRSQLPCLRIARFSHGRSNLLCHRRE